MRVADVTGYMQVSPFLPRLTDEASHIQVSAPLSEGGGYECNLNKVWQNKSTTKLIDTTLTPLHNSDTSTTRLRSRYIRCLSACLAYPISTLNTLSADRCKTCLPPQDVREPGGDPTCDGDPQSVNENFRDTLTPQYNNQRPLSCLSDSTNTLNAKNLQLITIGHGSPHDVSLYYPLAGAYCLTLPTADVYLLSEGRGAKHGTTSRHLPL